MREEEHGDGQRRVEKDVADELGREARRNPGRERAAHLSDRDPAELDAENEDDQQGDEITGDRADDGSAGRDDVVEETISAVGGDEPESDAQHEGQQESCPNREQGPR